MGRLSQKEWPSAKKRGSRTKAIINARQEGFFSTMFSSATAAPTRRALVSDRCVLLAHSVCIFGQIFGAQ